MQVFSLIIGILMLGGLLFLIVWNVVGIVKNIKARKKSSVKHIENDRKE